MRRSTWGTRSSRGFTPGGLEALEHGMEHGPWRTRAREVLQAGQHLAHDTAGRLASGPGRANETPAIFVVQAGAYAPGWESHRRGRRPRGDGLRARARRRLHAARSGGPPRWPV